jgi:hypothetical protein
VRPISINGGHLNHTAPYACVPKLGHYNRTQLCWAEGITEFIYNKQGDLVGTDDIGMVQTMQLNIKSTSFIETDTVVGVDPSGEVPADLTMSLAATCGSGCKIANNFPKNSPVEVGVKGTLVYSESVASGAVNQTDTFYTLDFAAPNFVPLQPPQWNTPLIYRCDNIIKNQRAGCVFPAYTSTLKYSRTTSGASAAMIQWAQQHLSGHWGRQGTGQPLTRLADTTKASTNRTTICKKAWVSKGTKIGGDFGDTDSCDEFPFAATYQSGALHGVKSGKQCAQVTAVETGKKGQTEAQRWNSVKPLGTVTGKEACIRGHIPNKLNGVTGGAYGNFINQQRLLDRDSFWVTVTS